MLLTYHTIKVGMLVKCTYGGFTSSGIIRFGELAHVESINSTIVVRWLDGYLQSKRWTSPFYFEEVIVNSKRKPRKIIPDIPLDPTLPILEAGHLQDRQRKKYK